MKIEKQMKQMINVEFLMKLGKNGAEICLMLQEDIEKNALKEWTLFRWVQNFREGQKDPKNDARSGCSSISCEDENIDCMHSIMPRDRQLTVTMISEALDLGKSYVHRIFTVNLGIKKVSAKMVPRLLTPEQKLWQKECYIDWKTSDDRSKSLRRAVTGDKT